MLPAATQRRLCSRPCLCKQPRRSTQGGPHLQHSRKHQPPLWPGCKHPAVVEAASTPAFDSFCCRTPPALLHELRPTVIALRQAFHPATRVGWLTALLVRSLAVIRSVLGLTSPLLLTCLLLCAGSVTLPHSRILGLSPCACHPATLACIGPITLPRFCFHAHPQVRARDLVCHLRGVLHWLQCVPVTGLQVPGAQGGLPWLGTWS